MTAARVRAENVPMTSPDRILIVDDDTDIRQLLVDYLAKHGLEAVPARDGKEMWQQLERHAIDLVVLDLMLPDADGLTLCRDLRARATSPQHPLANLPVLMLTARGEDTDRILGLEMGADDYVPKPVQPRVLLARIRALLRRTDKTVEDEVAQRIEFDDLVIDNGGRSVTLNGELVDFTSAEYDLLWLLASNAGRILSREDIFERLRGIEYDGQDRSIDVRISRIRPKIGDDPENPKRIKTVRSKGYLFVKETNGL